MKLINLNAQVKIKFKDNRGPNRLSNYYDTTIEEIMEQYDEHGLYTMSLWEFCRLFGDDMYNGNMNPMFNVGFLINDEDVQDYNEGDKG